MYGFGENNRRSGIVLTDDRMDAKEYTSKIDKIGGTVTPEVASVVEARYERFEEDARCQG